MERAVELAKKYYSTVPLYRNISELYHIGEIESMKDIPIINKKDFIGMQSKCINPEYCKKYLSNNLLISRTSGSTGSYLQVIWDKTDIKCSLLELWLKRVKYYNIFPHNKLLYFFTDGAENEIYREGKNELGINKRLLLPHNIKEAYNVIIKWDPDWMILQPGTAILLYMHIQQNKLSTPTNLKYIEFTGEMLEPRVRKTVETVFGCVTADQYGANEVGTIAYECPERRLHIMRSNVFVEIISDDGNVLADSTSGVYTNDEIEGRIVLTSLNNKAMPFVRYDIGDRGYISKKSCDCGCKSPALMLSGGRNNDFIFFTEDGKISSYIFVELLDKINKIINGGILQFYIEQNDYDSFVIRLYIDEDFNELEVSKIVSNFLKANYPYEAKFRVEFVDYFMDLGVKGKYTYFKNNIKK